MDTLIRKQMLPDTYFPFFKRILQAVKSAAFTLQTSKRYFQAYSQKLTQDVPDRSDNLSELNLAGQVLKLYGNSILRAAFSYLHNLQDAEDILQDTLLVYLNKTPAFKTEAHQKAWLLRVAINLSKNKIKRKTLHPEDELSDFIPAPSRSDDFELLWSCVRKLPVKYEEVIHLYYQEGYSTADIAKILRKKDSTVRTLLSRARQILKAELKEAYDFDE